MARCLDRAVGVFAPRSFGENYAAGNDGANIILIFLYSFVPKRFHAVLSRVGPLSEP